MMGGSIIFPCPDWNVNLKFSVRFLVSDNGGQSSFHVQAKSLILKFIVNYWSVILGVNHLALSNLNRKFKNFQWGSGQQQCGWGQSSFIKYYTFRVRFWLATMGGSIIISFQSYILNLKFAVTSWSVTMGGQSSFHVQAKSSILNVQWDSGQWQWGSIISPCQAKSLI